MKLLLHNQSKKVRLNTAKAIVEQLEQEKLQYFIHIRGFKVPCSKERYESHHWKHRSTSYECED